VANFASSEERDERTELRREITAPDAVRLAAQLDLGEDGGLVLLTASYSLLAPALNGMVNATYLLVDPDFAIPGLVRAVGMRLLDRIPLIDGALRAAAVDDSRASPAFLGEVVRCVCTGGRIVAPSDSSPPGNVRVLARDQREWVGQVERLPPLVTPQRRVSR
jgi:hypothetical protein